MSATDDPEFELHQWNRREQLVYKLRLSALVHEKRARYYELTAKLMQAIAVLGSTAAVSQLVTEHRPVQLWASVVVAVVSTLTLVYTPSSRANVHSNLVRDYRKLLASVLVVGEHPEVENLDRWLSDSVALEAQEPRALGALVAECQYILNLSAPAGSPPIPRPTAWKRSLMHWIDFTPEKSHAPTHDRVNPPA